MEIRVKIDAPELAQAIQSLAGALTKNPNLIDLENAKSGKAQKETTKEVPKTESEPKQEKEPKVEDLRAKAAEKAKEGKKDEIKALLDEFGVKTVSAVPKAKRAEFLERLGEL